MNLLQVFVHIMIEKLKIFLFHGDRQTQLGITFKASFEAMQVEIGSTSQFFSLKYSQYGFLTPSSWLSTLWDATSRYGVTLTPGNWTLQPPRENDSALMDAIVACHLFTINEMSDINRCRLYLRVFFLSDIVSGNGLYIIPEIVRGERFPQWQSMWKWPRQSRPPPSSWRLWNIAISEVWAKSESLRLQNPLGNWIHKTHMRFQYKIDSTNNILYENNHGVKTKYVQDVSRNSR